MVILRGMLGVYVCRYVCTMRGGGCEIGYGILGAYLHACEVVTLLDVI